MKLGLFIVLALLLLIPSSCATPSKVAPEQTALSEEPSIFSVIAEVSPAVVWVVVDYGKQHSSGTGMFITAEGYVLTNEHVVSEGYYATLNLPDKRSIEAQIIYRDPELDIAILKCAGGNYPVVTLGSMAEPMLGEDVVALGYPSAAQLGESVSLSKGIISAFRTMNGIRYIQTDVSLNPGSSGGPLVNMSGEVIGMNSWALREAEGINFAIKLENIKMRIESIVQQHIDGRLAVPKPPVEKTEEQVVVNTLPFTYTGKGNSRTSTFTVQTTYAISWKIAFTTTWDGDVSITLYTIRKGEAQPVICRSTGTWNDFPDKVKSGVTYEFVDYEHTFKECYLEITDAPPDGEWTIAISEAGPLIEIPFHYYLGCLTIFLEYDGDSVGNILGGHYIEPEPNWGRISGNRRTTYSRIQPSDLPIVCNFWKTDEGTGPMTLGIIYECKVVAEKTVTDQDEVHVVWLGPSDALTPEPYSPPESTEMAYAAGELDNVQTRVWALMDTHVLMLLPNPVTVPTNDMSAFPDTSVCGVDKIEDRHGNIFTAGDKDGYILYQHDSIADGAQGELKNYSNKQYTKGTYTVDACGKVTQVTTGYE